MVWDIGTYEVVEGNYYKGQLHLVLEGKKLKGEWLMVKDAGKGDRQWLLLKIKRGMRQPKNDDASAVTGRSMDRIAADNDAQWESNRAQRASRSR